MKYFDFEDTNSVIGRVEMIRDTNDTLLGGVVWINADDSTERYYDLKHVYFINHRTETITRYDAHDNQIFAMTGSIVKGLMRVSFLKTDGFKNQLTDSTITISLTDTTIDAKEFHHLFFKMDDDDPLYDMSKSTLVNKEKFQIEKMEFSASFQNQTQYNSWELSNIEFDNVTIENLNKRLEKYKETYKIKDYEIRSREEAKPLENGVMAPNFSGVLYPNNDSIHSKDYLGKIVLIDFWYKSCYPCIQAIPHIGALNKKFSDQGLVVFGLNPHNNKEEQLKQFPEFIEINKMDYPIVFVEDTVPKMFKVSGYPTFYVIDRNGKIAYSGVAFGESTESKLESVL